MRVNAPIVQTSSLFSKSSQSMARRVLEEPATGGARRGDRATFSPQGKLISMVQNLTDRKKTIGENKQILISRTLESGGDTKLIQPQLDSYDEQMGEIDEQITQLTADFAARMAEEATREAEKSAEKSTADDKTPEQSQVERMNDLAFATDKVQSAQTLSAAKDKVVGMTKVQESEIQLGELEIQRFEAKGSGLNLEDMISRLRGTLSEKKLELPDLKALAHKLDLSAAEQLRQAADKVEVKDTVQSPQTSDEVDTEETPTGEDPEEETGTALVNDLYS